MVAGVQVKVCIPAFYVAAKSRKIDERIYSEPYRFWTDTSEIAYPKGTRANRPSGDAISSRLTHFHTVCAYLLKSYR